MNEIQVWLVKNEFVVVFVVPLENWNLFVCADQPQQNSNFKPEFEIAHKFKYQEIRPFKIFSVHLQLNKKIHIENENWKFFAFQSSKTTTNCQFFFLLTKAIKNENIFRRLKIFFFVWVFELLSIWLKAFLQVWIKLN